MLIKVNHFTHILLFYSREKSHLNGITHDNVCYTNGWREIFIVENISQNILFALNGEKSDFVVVSEIIFACIRCKNLELVTE